jgi:hypothetical protein
MAPARRGSNQYVTRSQSRPTPMQPLDLIPKASMVADPNCSAEVLEYLRTRTGVATRRQIAEHPNASMETLTALTKDQSQSVRASLVQNPNCPSNILHDMAYSAQTLTIRMTIAKHLNTDSETLDHLADDPESLVRTLVCINPKTPLSALIRLATDDFANIRYTVATNPNLPDHLRAMVALGE